MILQSLEVCDWVSSFVEPEVEDIFSAPLPAVRWWRHTKYLVPLSSCAAVGPSAVERVKNKWQWKVVVVELCYCCFIRGQHSADIGISRFQSGISKNFMEEKNLFADICGTSLDCWLAHRQKTERHFETRGGGSVRAEPPGCGVLCLHHYVALIAFIL